MRARAPRAKHTRLTLRLLASLTLSLRSCTRTWHFPPREEDIMTFLRNARLAASAMFLAAAACAPAHPRVVYVVREPPPEVVETIPPSPGPQYVWVRGHYRWEGSEYVWVPGHWQVPPQGYTEWVPGHWARRDGGWVWVEGHWR
jgi:hypothetical protein